MTIIPSNSSSNSSQPASSSSSTVPPDLQEQLQKINLESTTTSNSSEAVNCSFISMDDPIVPKLSEVNEQGVIQNPSTESQKEGEVEESPVDVTKFKSVNNEQEKEEEEEECILLQASSSSNNANGSNTLPKVEGKLPRFELASALKLKLSQECVNRIAAYSIVHDINVNVSGMAAHDPYFMGSSSSTTTNNLKDSVVLLDEEFWFVSVVADELDKQHEELGVAPSPTNFLEAIGERAMRSSSDYTTTTTTTNNTSTSNTVTPNPLNIVNSTRTSLWKPGRSWWEAKSGKNPWLDPEFHAKRWRLIWPLVHYHKFLAKCIKKLKRCGVDCKESTVPIARFLRNEVIAVSVHLASLSEFDTDQWKTALQFFESWSPIQFLLMNKSLTLEILAKQKSRSMRDKRDAESWLLKHIFGEDASIERLQAQALARNGYEQHVSYSSPQSTSRYRGGRGGRHYNRQSSPYRDTYDNQRYGANNGTRNYHQYYNSAAAAGGRPPHHNGPHSFHVNTHHLQSPHYAAAYGHHPDNSMYHYPPAAMYGGHHANHHHHGYEYYGGSYQNAPGTAMPPPAGYAPHQSHPPPPTHHDGAGVAAHQWQNPASVPHTHHHYSAFQPVDHHHHAAAHPPPIAGHRPSYSTPSPNMRPRSNPPASPSFAHLEAGANLLVATPNTPQRRNVYNSNQDRPSSGGSQTASSGNTAVDSYDYTSPVRPIPSYYGGGTTTASTTAEWGSSSSSSPWMHHSTQVQESAYYGSTTNDAAVESQQGSHYHQHDNDPSSSAKTPDRKGAAAAAAGGSCNTPTPKAAN